MTETRTKPSYHVFQELEKGVYRQLTDNPITDSVSSKDAISKASAGESPEVKYFALKPNQIKLVDKPSPKGTSKVKQLEAEIAALRAERAQSAE